jgi:hypothetical protein
VTYREQLSHLEAFQDLEQRLGSALSEFELAEMERKARKCGLTLEEALEHAALNMERHMEELRRKSGTIH